MWCDSQLLSNQISAKCGYKWQSFSCFCVDLSWLAVAAILNCIETKSESVVDAHPRTTFWKFQWNLPCGSWDMLLTDGVNDECSVSATTNQSSTSVQLTRESVSPAWTWNSSWIQLQADVISPAVGESRPCCHGNPARLTSPSCADVCSSSSQGAEDSCF